MKREFIKEQIENLIPYPEGDFSTLADDLTDLFIQLSEERCIDQRMICSDEYFYACNAEHVSEHVNDRILNAPFPTLD